MVSHIEDIIGRKEEDRDFEEGKLDDGFMQTAAEVYEALTTKVDIQYGHPYSVFSRIDERARQGYYDE